MIDWLTFSIDASNLSPQIRELLDLNSERLVKISPDGDIAWESRPIERLRSDMNGLSYKYGSSLMIMGSPASVVSPNNVFGTSCLMQGFNDMISFFDHHISTSLPRDPLLWSCSRIDVTQNYDLGGQIAVNQFLDYASKVTTRGDNVERKHSTVYWNKSSSLRAGKAYNKYQHARKLTKKNQAYYTREQLKKTEHLLRLELKLGRKWLFKQNLHWSQLTENHLQTQHTDFFKDIINDIEVPTMDTLLEKLIEVSPTEGQAKSALDYFYRIKSMGSKTARAMTTDRTHYRHVKNLKMAGLTTADITSGEIHYFRPRTITMRPVNDWSQININTPKVA